MNTKKKKKMRILYAITDHSAEEFGKTLKN